MKMLKRFIAVALLPLLLMACSKDKHTDTPVTGTWNGLWGNDNATPIYLYRLNIKPGGVIEELNAAGLVKGSGTWQLNGNSFTAHYQWKAPLSTVFTVAATYNPASHSLSGTWGFDNSPTGGGTWHAEKND